MAFMGWRSIRHLSYFLVALIAFGCESSPDEAGVSTGESSTDASAALGNQDSQLARDATLLPDAVLPTPADQAIIDMQGADNGIADAGTAPDADISGHPDMESEVPDALVGTRCDPETEYEQTPPTETSDGSCATLTQCDPALEYEQIAPTATSDRVCAALTQCDLVIEYEEAPPTVNTDRVCSPLTQCDPTSSYEQRPPSPTQNRECAPFTVCQTETEFERIAPSGFTDRVCGTLTVCDSETHYELIPPTATSDRVCAALTECNQAFEYEESPPNETSDRECVPLTTCSHTEFEAMPPTATTDRICTPLTICRSDQFELVAASATTDRQCAVLSECDFETQYESVPPTPSSDRECSPLSTCATNEYESTAPGPLNDRVCTLLGECGENRYERSPATANSDRVCESLTVCNESEYESASATPTSDRVCTLVTECNVNQYQSRPPSSTSDRECSPISECSANEYEVEAATETTDRVCASLLICDAQFQYELEAPTPTSDRICAALTRCDSTQFELNAPTTTSDRVCQTLTICDPALQFEGMAPTDTSDRICQNLTVCQVDEYESEAATSTTDRSCDALTQCTPEEFQLTPPTSTTDRICSDRTSCSENEYEVTPPTQTSDRVCRLVTQCAEGEYESMAPTQMNDRVCRPLTECTGDQFEATPPTDTSDRICQSYTECLAGQYESMPRTDTSDRECQTLTACGQSEYESMAPTPTSDRICRPITECSAEQFESSAPTLTSDRTCQMLTVCSAEQFESTPPTHNADRICDDLTVCGQDEEESVPPTSTTDRQCEVVCDPETVLQNNGCTSAGCHSPPVRANLDLTSPGFEANLLNAVSPTEGCEGRLIIDVERPEHSLLLQVVGVYPPLGGDIDTCQTVMPPWGGMSEQDQSCLSDWVTDLALDAQSELPEPDPFEATPIFSAMRKVKTLLHGDAPTSDELAQVLADPNALRTLVTQWVETEAFKTKMNDFFTVTLQQRFQVEDLQQFDRLRRSGDFSRGYTRILEESFVRTALDIIERDLPFTDVVTTRTWMVTTANLVLLKYGDQLPSEKGQIHDVGNDDTVYPQALSDQIAQRKWLVPSLPSDCALPQHEVLDMFFGLVLARRCPDYSGSNLRPNDGPLTAADFTDWRLVELVPTAEEPELPLLPFYDVESLRTATRVATRLPRVGFFTSSVFLNNWATNIDNQFRVTTNQSLLAALNIGFSSSEPTMPVSTDGLDDMHSAPGSACYGCHKQIDPMRLYFSKHFDINYQQPSDPPGADSPVDPTLTPSFAFRNHTHLDGDLYDYANILTTHPRFPYAWVQKLCAYANSKRCDERDPLFLQIAEDFRDNGYQFKDLVIDLFSSPLVTGVDETETTRLSDAIISITRLNHLCPMLVERTGRADICDVSRVKSVRGLIARDDFARGAVEITQPALSSAFHFAAVEAICEAVSRSAVGGSQPYFKPADANLVPMIVTKLMGIPEEHERYASTLAILNQHYEDLRTEGLNRTNRARGVFTLACMSGDVMGVGL